jgi:hypothetical protein
MFTALPTALNVASPVAPSEGVFGGAGGHKERATK